MGKVTDSEIDRQPESHRGAFAVILAAGFMTLLDVSIVNVALPSIESALGAGPDELQWIVAGYALAFGVILVAAGRAGDIFGRRRLFIIGLTGFVVTSLACGLAPTGDWLAGMRFLQGLFAGILNPQVLGLIQEFYSGKARAKAFGIFGIVVGISTAIGPIVGGLLIALAGPEHGWRLIFLINVPLGMIVIPLAAKLLPKPAPRPDGGDTKRSGARGILRTFDPVGAALLGFIVVAIMWPFLSSSGETGPAEHSSTPYWTLLVALALLAILLVWERWWRRSGGSALLDPVLFKRPSFVLGVVAAFTYFSGFTSIFLVLTLYLQQGLGWTPLMAGLAAGPFAVLSGISSGLSGRLVNRFGRSIPVIGSLIVTLALLGMAAAAHWLPTDHAPWGVIVASAFAGIGSGLVISPNQALTLEGAPLRVAGLAAALLQTFQRLGTAIGLSAVTTAFFITVSAARATNGVAEANARGLVVACLVIAGLVFMSVIANGIDWARRDNRTADDLRDTINTAVAEEENDLE